MKYVSLRISNYRGVSEAKIEFAETGITVVRGPNEAGKTSLGEAIRLLFEYPDNSRHRDVLAIKPVHKDEGPEIELEAESGKYRFNYFKRFFKKPETRLMITAPKAESLTSRQAHARAMAILSETLDVNLWKALGIKQGDEISQPVLKNQAWLSAALDRAAGGHSTDPRAEGLFAEVHKEYLKYFTENGTERREITQFRDTAANHKLAVQEIEQTIRELEKDVETAGRLEKELAGLRRNEHDLTVDVAKRSAKVEEISALERNVSDAKLRLEAAEALEKAARGDKDARDTLINEIKATTKAVAKLDEAEKDLVAGLSRAERELNATKIANSDADKKLKETVALVGLLQHDCGYFQDKLDLEMMQERKARVDQATKNSSDAKVILERNKVDKKALESVEKAKIALISAQTNLGAKAPFVLVRGLGAAQLDKDGVTIKLKNGEELPYNVTDKVKFTVPKKFEIEISAGSSLDALSRKAKSAQEELDAVCASFGIPSVDQAREAFEERQRASAQIANLEQIEKDNLRDLSYDDLSQRITVLQQSVPAYLPGRIPVPPMCDDLESAKVELAKAEELRDTAETKVQKAKSANDKANETFNDQKGKHIKVQAQHQQRKTDLAGLEKVLKKARTVAPDKKILIALDDATKAAAKARDDLARTDALLKQLNPEQERDLEQTARESLGRIQKRLKDADTELVEVRTRLKFNGEEGLSEKLNFAESALEKSAHEYSSLDRRAAAAKLLHSVMDEERAKAHHAYINPLKQRVEALGRMVFDETLDVEISDDLQIAKRTLRGATVDFDSLSGGTKEQLSLMLRLACAMIVAKDGGAPVMLDDALGYTDPERLLLMGAVLSKAGKECQIVIFTCVPDRYSNIGAAKEIVLAG